MEYTEYDMSIMDDNFKDLTPKGALEARINYCESRITTALEMECWEDYSYYVEELDYALIRLMHLED